MIVPGMQDGRSIISGWSDGRIRAFGPQSGKLLYTINDAHFKGVTALAATSDSCRIISGGEEGGRPAPAAAAAPDAADGQLTPNTPPLPRAPAPQAWCASGASASRAR
jgi:hypothetical protein